MECNDIPLYELKRQGLTLKTPPPSWRRPSPVRSTPLLGTSVPTLQSRVGVVPLLFSSVRKVVTPRGPQDLSYSPTCDSPTRITLSLPRPRSPSASQSTSGHSFCGPTPCSSPPLHLFLLHPRNLRLCAAGGGTGTSCTPRCELGDVYWTITPWRPETTVPLPTRSSIVPSASDLVGRPTTVLFVLFSGLSRKL